MNRSNEKPWTAQTFVPHIWQGWGYVDGASATLWPSYARAPGGHGDRLGRVSNDQLAVPEGGARLVY